MKVKSKMQGDGSWEKKVRGGGMGYEARAARRRLGSRVAEVRGSFCGTGRVFTKWVRGDICEPNSEQGTISIYQFSTSLGLSRRLIKELPSGWRGSAER